MERSDGRKRPSLGEGHPIQLARYYVLARLLLPAGKTSESPVVFTKQFHVRQMANLTSHVLHGEPRLPAHCSVLSV